VKNEKKIDIKDGIHPFELPKFVAVKEKTPIEKISDNVRVQTNKTI